MKNLAIAIIDRSDYGAIELKKNISKSTFKGYFVALLVLISAFSILYFAKTHIIIVPKQYSTPIIPLINFEPKITENPNISKSPIEVNIKVINSEFKAGLYIPVDDSKIDPNSPDIAPIENQGTSDPIGGGNKGNEIENTQDLPQPKLNVPNLDETNQDTFISVEKEVGFSYDDLKRSVVYPETARKAGIEGIVIVQALIGIDGKVIRTKILDSKNKYLNLAAEEAKLRFNGFSPAIQNQRIIEMWISIPIEFKIR